MWPWSKFIFSHYYEMIWFKCVIDIFRHGIQTNEGQQVFSCMGIRIVVDYFINRGHKNVKAFVPRFRRGMSDRRCPTTRGDILDELEKRNNLIYTPSRYVGNQLICPYDDRFILRAAQHYNAVIVSNDNYRDLRQENAEWDHLVKYK
jgi:ribonuclease ZC3H12